ncbi:hypothetical protein A5844_001528 [Enterococcus sp. 10A9_DIV0425]|uniref:Uncharacterized protein n=1 Tax=Candidatus Enterococcus wittei TaxID=1987383 RepID=A0A242K1F4_9ENTE|nr:hypothetical protein [Enterococcus sp. 10A9_DIV0425]OTP11393.1 hypothetical protein A5844_001528 [Enterococcus sp. 10A9_DIV0425]THE11972.1 hypothetical protein E1H99_08015 [Enterococcus hirae]
MSKKHKLFMISIAILSVIHLLFSYYYLHLYGHFNLQGNLNSFLLISFILRLLLDLYIVTCGFLAIREDKQKVLPFYLLFFLFNLVLPFLFHI